LDVWFGRDAGSIKTQTTTINSNSSIDYLLSPQEAQKASRKPPEYYKKIQGRNLGNDFVGILDETIIS
jgi:hypothetical protein